MSNLLAQIIIEQSVKGATALVIDPVLIRLVPGAKVNRLTLVLGIGMGQEIVRDQIAHARQSAYFSASVSIYVKLHC